MVGRSSLLLGAALLWGCAAEPAPSPAAAEPAARAGCAIEAERLLQPAAIRATPLATAVLLAELEAGRFVYRCERRGNWLAVMYPAAGEPVDCSRRGDDRACAIGWTLGEIATEIYG
jgi:hypothetical protein